MSRLISLFHFLLILLFIGDSGRNLTAQEKKPERWEKEIVSIEKRIAEGKSWKNSTLFVGSSSIRLWNLEMSFPDLTASNHGFGGSVLSDSVHFFDRIVVPVVPRVIVIYAGDNDLATGKTPETVHADFLTFVSLTEKKLPDCEKVIYLSIKPSVKRWALADKIQQTNSMIRTSCEANPRLQFVDIWTPMLGPDGRPNADLLIMDGLHMNDKGYKIWAEALKPWLPVAEAK